MVDNRGLWTWTRWRTSARRWTGRPCPTHSRLELCQLAPGHCHAKCKVEVAHCGPGDVAVGRDLASLQTVRAVTAGSYLGPITHRSFPVSTHPLYTLILCLPLHPIPSSTVSLVVSCSICTMVSCMAPSLCCSPAYLALAITLLSANSSAMRGLALCSDSWDLDTGSFLEMKMMVGPDGEQETKCCFSSCVAVERLETLFVLDQSNFSFHIATSRIHPSSIYFHVHPCTF